jgi:hypothetical protein
MQSRRENSTRFHCTDIVALDDDEASVEEVQINFESRHTPIKRREPSKSMDFSLHSMLSTRSQLTVERPAQPFEDDNAPQKVFRYLRVLPPHPDEKPDKKWSRIYTWGALVLDFVAGMVSILSYDGVTTCCGVPIYSVAANINWNKAIRITTYVYMALIFCEIIPVVRGGLPFNLINPLVGFTIFFAMFFDDRASEAIVMWFIESTAIILEFFVYRIKSKFYHEKNERLDELDKELEMFRGKSKKNIRVVEDSDEDESLSENSFGEEETEDPEDPEVRSTSSFGGSNPELREMRLLRERRMLRQTQKADRVELRYHFTGVMMNFGLVGISLTLVIAVASSGGLCLRNFEAPVIFSYDQLDRCDLCQDYGKGVCEVCNEEDGTSQCYYPYY